jgi:hypothetical protein
MANVKIRPALVALAATVEKRMQQVLDGKVDLNKEPDTKKFRKGIEAQTARFLTMVTSFEDQGDPDIDTQMIQNKMADCMIMLYSTLMILSSKQARQ